MSVLPFLYSAFLRLAGLSLIATALASVAFRGAPATGSVVATQASLPASIWMVVALVGLFVLVPWWQPASLRTPRRSADVLIWTVLLGVAGYVANALVIDMMSPSTGPTTAPAAILSFAFILPTLAFALLGRRRRMVRPKKRPAAPVADSEPQMDIDNTPSAPARSPALFSIHRAFVAICGVGILTFALGILLAFRRDPAFMAVYADLGALVPVQAGAAVGILAGGSLLFARSTPGFVTRPTRWFHFFGIGIYLTLLAAIAPLVFALVPVSMVIKTYSDPAQIAAMSDFLNSRLMLLPGVVTSQILGAVANLALIVTTILMIRHKPADTSEDEALRPYSSKRVSDVPEVAPKKNMNKGKLPEPKLPSIGAAMKLYVIADWLVMRLLGLGMLGTAYILWQLIQGGRDYQAFQISYGQNPMHALYAYGAIGALMTVPYLLPRFITAPRHVIGGLLKAVLLAGTAFILLPMLHVGIEMFTPEIYWATLHATAPSVFKALAGVAVTSALLISFFRQLGNVPQVDYTGKPVLVLSEQELRSLRAARAEN